MAIPPSGATVGRVWVDDEGRIWRQVSYTNQPTATFTRVDDPSQRLSGVVGSRVLADLRLLRPEDDDNGR